MKAVIQRVTSSQVIIDNHIHQVIQNGLLVLLGIEVSDTEEDIKWLAQKIVNMRIFSDENGKMNLSVNDIKGEILLISQFTLHASTKKGNRPSFTQAAPPDIAIPIYEKMIKTLDVHLLRNIKTGIFGADMKVDLINDGPVTIVMDSKDRK